MIRVDGRIDAVDIDRVARSARKAESRGYATLWTSETAHDPFLPLPIAAAHTDTVGLGCAIAVAFARNPMSVAYTAHDLQCFTRGRFTLGLGTQVAAHVRRRFSMPWSQPVERMTEFVTAVRSILRAWQDGERPRFDGDFYQHTLSSPFFTPPAHEFGVPSIFLAAVGRRMTEAAGRVADGVFAHAFTTADYLRDQVLPEVDRGLRASGRTRAQFQVNCRAFLATGRDSSELTAATDAVRGQIAFYASTPAYRPVLERHGWGKLGDRLHELSVSDTPGKWRAMAGLVDDEVVGAFAVVAPPELAAREILRRYGGIADRIRYYTPYPVDEELTASITADMAAIQNSGEPTGDDDK